MTLPARTTRGSLGFVVGLAPDASHEFTDIAPPLRARKVTLYLRTNRVLDLRVDRVSPDTGASLLLVRRIESDIVAGTPPADETVVVLDFAVRGSLRVTVTNEGLANATVTLEVSWEG